MHLYPKTMENVRAMKYRKPTPIQRYAVPVINDGRDLMACAQTGSGKTLAFVLPLLTGIVRDDLFGKRSDTGVPLPAALVLCPTRELAIQIRDHVSRFARGTMVRVVLCYGGVSIKYNLSELQTGCDILIATPGRVKDLALKRGVVDLSRVKYFVLDEADRMLDMGFEGDVREVGGAMPAKTERQTLLFSATFPERIQTLGMDFMTDHIYLRIGIVGGANPDVHQEILAVGQHDKREKLVELLTDMPDKLVLVFVEQKRQADFLASYLSQSNFIATSIHGDREQCQREEALREFKAKRAPILIATNVAARGLDIQDVEMVVNFDVPHDEDEFVHRIGRTGRCGNEGRAVTFFDESRDNDIMMSRAIVRLLREAEKDVPDWLDKLATERGGGGNFGGNFGNERDIRMAGAVKGDSTAEPSTRE